MASLRERGGKVSVVARVDGKQTSIAFDDRGSAERFLTLVHLLGKGRKGDSYGWHKAKVERQAEHEHGFTVDQLAEAFFEWKASSVEPRTIKDYRRDYANHVKAALGHRQADAIDELDVQQWVDKLARTLDPKTVADRHALLAGMYKFGSAKVRRLVTHNPTQETQLPKRHKKPPKGFSLPEWQAILAWATEHEPDAADLLLFFASTGWRFSEATPITAAAVEDYGDQIAAVDGEQYVVPQVWVSVRGVHRRDENDQTVYVDGKAKTGMSIRRINLPPDAAQVVRRRMVGKGPSDLLFTNRHGNQWRSNNFLEREFARILDGAGIAKAKGMGAHYLRHTQVAMLDRAHVSLAKTQRRIGHKSITTTFGTYGGMIDNSLEPEELVRLGALIVKPEAAGQVVRGEVVTPALGASERT